MKRLTPVLFLAASSACTHFVEVDTSRAAPVFSWPAGAGVSSLAVSVDPSDCEGAPDDRYWWHVSGDLKPPITYGVVPRGASETINAKPLTDACDSYVVTITNSSMQSESRSFSP